MARQFSRMNRLQEKRNLRQAVLFGLGTILVIIFMATAGFSLLARAFIFIGDLKSGAARGTEKTDFIPPGPPQLVVPFEATNSASFSIKGIAEPGSVVYLSLNGDEFETVNVPEEGVFEFEKVTLELGKNTFNAVAVDDAGNRSQISSSVFVQYSNTPPKLEITSPTDRQVFTGKENRITVKGKADSGARVVINDRVAIVDSAGGFQKQMELISGDNVFVVVATDIAGNQERKEFTIVYNP